MLISFLRNAREHSALTFAQLARVSGCSSSSLHRAAQQGKARLDVVRAFAASCGADPQEAERLWKDARPRLPGAPTAEELEEIDDDTELLAAMKQLIASQGSPSLRQVAGRAGTGVLPRSTLAEVLAGRARLRPEHLSAFVSALGGAHPEQWLAALERCQLRVGSQKLVSLGSSSSLVNTRMLIHALADLQLSDRACLAEFIDLALTPASGLKDSPTTVEIYLTASGAPGVPDRIRFRDDGPGFEVGELIEFARGALTSGVTTGLGLTAMLRLGQKITLQTARAHALTWTRLSFDFRQPDAGEPVCKITEVRKDHPADHGTRITISALRETWKPGRTARIRTWLGDAYSYPLRHGHVRIELDGRAVAPRVPCVWDRSRTVSYRNRRAAAIVDVDLLVPATEPCPACPGRRADAAALCEVCRGRGAISRGHRVWGWFGVQRYVDRVDFGMDFLHRGRTILFRDKRLFQWRDPSDPAGTPILEYPVDGPAPLGRIVGEVHVDHLQPTYTKDAFADDANWHAVLHALRGPGPLLPGMAARLGYSRNDSPLAAVLHPFRRIDPGLDRLIPGNGQQAVHEQARAWAKRFRAGDPEFQSDEVWHRAARDHTWIATGYAPAPPTSEDVRAALGLPADDHSASRTQAPR